MKSFLKAVPPVLLFLMLSLSCGCEYPWAPKTYMVVKEHTDTTQSVLYGEQDISTATDYDEICSCILYFIQNHVEQGEFRISTGYHGDVDTDINNALYNIWRNDPLGAYSIDYITENHSKLLSYYEVRLTINFRKSKTDISRISPVRGLSGTRFAISTALQNYDSGVTLRVSSYSESIDVDALINEYISSHVSTCMEQPKVSYSIYPETGNDRILDIHFEYEHTTEELQQMQKEVADILSSAANYVRFREDTLGKAELLFSYLKERFTYVPGESATPVYSFLCEGIYSSKTAAEVFTLLCNRIGIPCVTVSGYSDGIPYYWNIISLDYESRHIDIAKDIASDLHNPVYYYDCDLTNYSWDHDTYPVCENTPHEEAATEHPVSSDDDSNPINP